MKKYFLYTMAAAFIFAAVFTSCETDKVEIPTYTVRFDSKGGTPTPQEQTVKEDGRVTKPADPTRDNYTFTGWAKADNEAAALWNFETETVSGDITLFARWAINTHAVTFDSDGGSAVTAQNVAHGSPATKPANPTRNGYEFDGWFSGETEWNFANAITAPITLKAKWAIVYNVIFDSDGGSEVPPQTVRNGNNATKPADPTKTIGSGLYLGTITGNYTFVGWYNGETLWNFESNTVTAPTSLKARWSLAGNAKRIESVLSNDVAAAFTYVNANSYNGEEYTLLIGTNISVGELTLNAANAKLTIIGLGEMRTITSTTSYTPLLTINGNNLTNLTIGQNITIGTNYAYIPINLIFVGRGSLTLHEGSKTHSVDVNGINAIFKMEGGEINGHNCTYIRNGGTFEMVGGRISNNTGPTGDALDVFIDYDCTFRLSGNARIGVLSLNANNATSHSTVTIVGNYSGTVTTLHLLGNNYIDINFIKTWWTNAQVIVNGTASVINLFNNGLGVFYPTYNSVSFYSPTPASISATHELNAAGILVLK